MYKIIYIHQAHICTLLFFFCPFSTCHFFYFCQKYLPLEHDFTSEEGHFLPILEGVKHLPIPHILHFFFVKSNILIAFCLFLFRYYEGKDYLYSWNIDIRSLCFL